MSAVARDLIVVGQGAAGPSAALSAAEEARTRNLTIHITLADKASPGPIGPTTLGGC